jgi:glycolate dehydrogenase iron-sulfur subunit
MQTTLSEDARKNVRADEAEAILRACVHCGFCNATCPTYQVLGNELDGPRGRI